MNIQISIVIWTIICFLLLMLILKNLLFKPVLTLMDARKERIEAAKRKAEEIERLNERNEQLKIEMEAQQKNENAKRLREETERLRAKTKEEIELASQERLVKVDQYRKEVKSELDQIVKTLEEKSEALALSFANKIFDEK